MLGYSDRLDQWLLAKGPEGVIDCIRSEEAHARRELSVDVIKSFSQTHVLLFKNVCMCCYNE